MVPIHFCITYEPQHDKTSKMTCAPSEDSDQPGLPPSLIRVFSVRPVGSLGLNCLHVDSEDGRKDHFVVVFHAAAQLFLDYGTHCNETDLRCGGKCMPKSFRCDYHRDCSDGTDEMDCPPPCK